MKNIIKLIQIVVNKNDEIIAKILVRKLYKPR